MEYMLPLNIQCMVVLTWMELHPDFALEFISSPSPFTSLHGIHVAAQLVASEALGKWGGRGTHHPIHIKGGGPRDLDKD